MKIVYNIYEKWLNYYSSLYEKKIKIWQLKNNLKQNYDKYHKRETSKIVLWFMLMLLLTIVIFTGYVTLRMMEIISNTRGMMDFTPLVALISAMIGQVIITLGYFIKSTKENSEGGVTYLNAQYQLNTNYIHPNEDNSDENEDTGGISE